MYPQSMFRAKIRKYQIFSAENFQFLKLKRFLYIAWACFHNAYENLPHMLKTDLQAAISLIIYNDSKDNSMLGHSNSLKRSGPSYMII